jgi:pimeloyl-ACP methyl ester carboxylesterase
VVPFGLVILTLILLYGLAACVIPDQPSDQPPEEALSHSELLANLDALQGPASRSLTEPDKSVFTLPGGARLSTRGLSAYIAGIRQDLAGYVYAAAEGKPYLVVPVRLVWDSNVLEPGLESGLMWVPFTWGQRQSFPVISYQHGTQVYEESVPSCFQANPLSVFYSPDQSGALQNYVECIAGALIASAGYIVLMPDYVGLGASTGPDHSYVTQLLGESVTGILDAAQGALAGRPVSPAPRLFLTGYSEGGYATMAGALALQGTSVVPAAVVPCAGAYDLSGTMLTQMLTQEVKVPSYLLYAASGYYTVYQDFDYGDLLTDYWADLMNTNNPFNGERTNAYIDSLGLPRRPVEMLKNGANNALVQTGGVVYQHLEDNNAWVGWNPAWGVPIFFVHCPADDVVPYANATVALNELPAGTVASLIDVPPVPFVDQVAGSIHVAAYPTAMLAAFKIIEEVNKVLP